jgi:hypothetical protein
MTLDVDRTVDIHVVPTSYRGVLANPGVGGGQVIGCDDAGGVMRARLADDGSYEIPSLVPELSRVWFDVSGSDRGGEPNALPWPGRWLVCAPDP